MVEHQPQLVHIHVDLGERPLHRLALGEIGAEGLALLGVGRAKLEAALHHAEAARAMADAAGIDPRLCVLETFALIADALPDRHPHVVEHDLPGLVVDHEIIGGRKLDAGRIHVDQESGDAATCALLRIGDREHLGEVGIVRAGDEALDAVDDVVVAIAHRGRAHGGGIGAGIGLGLGEAAGLLAADHRHEVMLARLPFQACRGSG